MNINASPYERNKDDVRLALLRRRAAEAGAPIVYVNTVGGQDELVFDGDSMVVAPDGEVLMRAPQFAEGVYYLDLEFPSAAEEPPQVLGEVMGVRRSATGASAAAPWPTGESAEVTGRIPDEAEVWNALVVGLRDYVGKNGFRSVVLGMSGGIDSAVVAADRRRRDRRRERLRGLDAECVLLRALALGRRGPRPAPRRALPDRARSGRWSTRSWRRWH